MTQLLLVSLHGMTGLSTIHFLLSLIVLAPLQCARAEPDPIAHTGRPIKHVMVNSLVNVTDWVWLRVFLGPVLDISSYSSSAFANRSRLPGYNGM